MTEQQAHGTRPDESGLFEQFKRGIRRRLPYPWLMLWDRLFPQEEHDPWAQPGVAEEPEIASDPYPAYLPHRHT